MIVDKLVRCDPLVRKFAMALAVADNVSADKPEGWVEWPAYVEKARMAMDFLIMTAMSSDFMAAKYPESDCATFKRMLAAAQNNDGKPGVPTFLTPGSRIG